MMRFGIWDIRLWLLIVAEALLAIATIGPQSRMSHDGYDLLAVVDVTGSMNVRDCGDNRRPVSRIDFVKSALRDMIARLPCPSRVALGVFAERQSFLLFEPIDACSDYGPIAGTISALDWRMAWEGDSRVSSGLFHAIEMARGLKTDLLFFTDGQEAPPLPASGGPAFDGQRGAVRGLIVGVGGYELSPIPKFDDKGRETGFYSAEDVPHESRFGLPPAGSEQREGYNARNAPFGSAVAVGSEHLSSVREPYLRSLAEKTGLTYTHLVDFPRLLSAYLEAGTVHSREAQIDLAPYVGGAAAAILITLYVAFPLYQFMSSRREHRNSNTYPRRQL